MLENGMLVGTPSPDESFLRNGNDLIVDWDERMIDSGHSYYGVHDSFSGMMVLVKDDPDSILDWLDSTEYEYDKPAFIKRYSELDTSSVIDDMMTKGWFIKDNQNESDIEFFKEYVNTDYFQNLEV